MCPHAPRVRADEENRRVFIHKKELIHPVVVTRPDPLFAQFLLEQFGGATGELSAGLQYFTQAQHTDDPALRDMLMDIATEEFGHLEVVAHLIEAHTKGSMQAAAYGARCSRSAARVRTCSTARARLGRALRAGGGEPGARPAGRHRRRGRGARHLRGADPEGAGRGSRQALVHLATREVSHAKMFMAALQSMNKLDNPLFGDLTPDDTVDLYFNLSQDNAPANDQPAP